MHPSLDAYVKIDTQSLDLSTSAFGQYLFFVKKAIIAIALVKELRKLHPSRQLQKHIIPHIHVPMYITTTMHIPSTSLLIFYNMQKESLDRPFN